MNRSEDSRPDFPDVEPWADDGHPTGLPPDYCPRCAGHNRGAPHSPKCPNR